MHGPSAACPASCSPHAPGHCHHLLASLLAPTPAVAIWSGRRAPKMPEPTPSWDGQQGSPFACARIVAGCAVLLLHARARAEQSAEQARSSATMPRPLPSAEVAAELEAAVAVAEPGTPADSVSTVQRQRGSSSRSSNAAPLTVDEVHLSEAAPLLAGRAGPSAPGLRQRQAHEAAPS